MAEIELLKSTYAQVVDSLFSKFIRLKPSSAGESSDIVSDEELISQSWNLSNILDGLREAIPSNYLEDWRRHTSFTHPLRSFIRGFSKSASNLEYSTQAFFKFYEMLVRFSHLCFPPDYIRSSVRSFHLCESPGAFISALNVYLKIQENKLPWQWYANSLNPHYEWTSPFDMFLDDELVTSTCSNWLFGPDDSGDILKWTNEYVSSIAAKVGKFSLITADGSVYCQDNPAEQERLIFPLLQREIDISLSLLQTNGTFIVKIYTSFLNDTVTLLSHLLACFKEVYAVKPSCSKPGNSEVYLLCSNYTPSERCEEESELPNSYRKVLLECSKFFVSHQMQMIWFNISTFGTVEDDLKDFIEQKKMNAAEIYEKIITISNFEKFAAELFSASFTLLKRPNPWKFGNLGGFIEGLRNITAQEAQILIENMVISDIVKGINVASEQEFRISTCWSCNCCQWTNDFCVNNWDMEDILKIGDAPPAVADIKHTLFLEPKTLALLKYASLEIRDMCSSVVSCDVNLNLEGLEEKSRDKLTLDNNSCVLRSQLDWISVLEDIFRHTLNHQDSKLRIIIPSSTLMLTRFTVSFIAFCSLRYENIMLLCPEENSQMRYNQLICSNPWRNVRSSAEFLYYFSIIKEKLTDDIRDRSHIYRFVPDRQLRCEHFYESIVRYNSFIARRLLGKFKL